MGPYNLLRLCAFVLLLSALLVVIAVLGGHGGVASNGLTPAPNTGVDRIAYVGLDGRIHTIRPDGREEQTISTGEGLFTWPTWSLDGRRLAFSGVVDGGELGPQAVLFGYNTVGRHVRQLHVRDPGIVSLVAEGAPHYAYWSPDGTRLAFIGSTAEDLKLFVDDLRDGDAPTPTLGGGPMWMDWSPDSRFLVVHRGADHFLVDSESYVSERLPVPSDGRGYAVPTWGPSSNQITFVSGDRLWGYGLYTAGVDIEGGSVSLDDLTLLDQVPQNTAFLWSPTGRLLALTHSRPKVLFHRRGILSIHSVVSIYSATNMRTITEIHDNVVAFFWAPDGNMLAYVTLTDLPGVLRWNILDLADFRSRPLVDFIPSNDQLTVFQYFDQYAHSHRLWSPDSSSLVFAGRLAGVAFSASTGQAHVDNIIVLHIEPFPAFQVIADGTLAFWSPR